MNLYTCTKCRGVFPEEAFGTNTKNGKQYLRTECKRCLLGRARRNTALNAVRPLGWRTELRALETEP